MTEEINSLADLRAGDLMFTGISGAPGFGVWLGEKLIGDSFEIGPLRVCHVGIVSEAGRLSVPYADLDVGDQIIRTSGQDVGRRMPRLVQAMPHGAEEIVMTEARHWTPKHAYVRLPEDYAGQGADAAAIARRIVAEKVAYSPLSYLAIAAWSRGLKAERLGTWIARRRPPVPFEGNGTHQQNGTNGFVSLPVEAICSVLVDQCWTLTGKKMMVNTAHQAVTPGAMASQLLWRTGAVWGGPGIVR